MPAFASFNDRLPDPTFDVSDAGAVVAGGNRGPGFASVSVQSNRPAQVSRTVSGRGVHRETASHHWEISITYHPMRRDQFDTVSSFLDAKNGRLNPFFVVLPQYSRPKDPNFATFVSSNQITVAGAHQSGNSMLTVQAGVTLSGSAKPGDYFTISDPNDVNHRKTYKVTRVETNADWLQTRAQPGLNQNRLHIFPPLVRTVSNGAVINWIDPRFRVIQKNDVTESQLNTDNLYQFQLQLEEIQA